MTVAIGKLAEQTKKAADANRKAGRWVQEPPDPFEMPPGTKAFDPNQARDSHGRWTSVGGVSAVADNLTAIMAAAPTTGEYLSMQRDGSSKLDPAKFHYDNTADLILKEGQAWTPPRPQGPPTTEEDKDLRGELGQCFKNAGTTALMYGGGRTPSNRYRYVEGYGYTPHGWPPIPVHHAWLVDPDDNVIETTWPEMGTEYVGVEVPPDKLRKLVLQNGYWGVLDRWEDGFPELQEPW